MVDRFEFLRNYNIEIFQNCRKAEFMVNTMNDCNLSLNAARTALELLCAEENPDYYQYDSLDEKVRSFISRTNPDDNICNALKTIKINGNEGSHGNGSIRKAKETIDLLEQVLIWYVCGYRGKKYEKDDFHLSEIRFAKLYYNDWIKPVQKLILNPLKTVAQKEQAKTVVADTTEAAPAKSAIDKEEKKRLKLERKAQEEAERKAKRNAERELKKQLQKEQKAKALEEARLRNAEAVAKANAKLQAQEDKKLAKEKELEKKRMRAEQKHIRVKQRAITQEQKHIPKYKVLGKEDDFCKEFNKELKSLYDQQQKWCSEEGIKASMMAWEKEQREKEYIEQCINNGTDFVLDLLVKTTLKKDASPFAIFNKYRDRLPGEMSSLEARYSDEVNEVYRIINKFDFESVSYDKLLNLTRIYSEFTFKMSIKKLVLCSIIGYNLINNDHKDVFESLYSSFWHIDQARNEFCEIYNDLHTGDAEKRFSKKDLFYKCCALKGLQEEVEERVNSISIKTEDCHAVIID